MIRILLIAALMLPTAARAEPAVTPIQETALVTGWSVMLYSKHCKALSQETKMVAIQMIAESKASPAAVEYWMDKLDGLRIKEGNDTFCRAVEEATERYWGHDDDPNLIDRRADAAEHRATAKGDKEEALKRSGLTYLLRLRAFHDN